jgi:hypothetical protein
LRCPLRPLADRRRSTCRAPHHASPHYESTACPKLPSIPIVACILVGYVTQTLLYHY